MTKVTEMALSDAQRDVVAHPIDLPGVVDAGAGTGKTFTIVERVAALHESRACPADKVLLLTFGRKAAAELRARIARRLGEAAPDCRTFHAFAWSILSAHLYDIGLSPETTVIEDVEARVEFKKAFDDFLSDPHAASSGFPLRPFNRDEIRDGLFSLRQNLKQEGRTVDEFRERALAAADDFGRVAYRELRQRHKRTYKGQEHKVIARATEQGFAQQLQDEKARVAAAVDVFRRFDKRLADRSGLTYADILARAEDALRSNPALRDELRSRYRCCIVDEYQDTDLAQARFLEALFGSDFACVMVVGDVLQSIYSFRGARPENVAAFKTAPKAKAYPLLENRRSLQEILDLAHHAVFPAHGDAQRLAGQRGNAGEQVVHVSSLWTDPRTGSRDYIPFDRARELEAEAVAKRIRHLLASGTQVETASGSAEAIAPRHIAILSRTKINVRPVTDALLAAGIPFRLVGGVGFYDAPEIRDALAWLRLLADPFDSQSAARALGSPAIGASDGVLAQLAIGLDKDETAFARRALIEEVANGGELGAQARRATDKLRALLDALAPNAALPLLGALRAALDLTGLERHHQTSSDIRAPQALANLEKLEALARGFAQDTPGAQPADFASFVDELERIEFDEREADVPSYDAVTISTIHSAKGLEWPVVFVLGVWPDPRARSRLFVDEHSGALLYGEGPDGSRPLHYVAATRCADDDGYVRREDDPDRERDDAEERRLFYVAITRARDRVFISGSRFKPSKQYRNGRPHGFLERAYDWLHDHGWRADEETPESAPFARTRDAVIAPQSFRSASQPVETARRDMALAVPLSYSLISKFEQCPRRATYRILLRVPEVGGFARRPKLPRAVEGLEAEDLAPADSLLGAGDYGEVLHKALELWALGKRAGEPPRRPASFIAAAVLDLALTPGRAQVASAERSMERIVQELESWRPLHVEAPFTLDFGEEGKPLLVSGYLDLLAQDGAGRTSLLDYKTGGARGLEYALQLALYRAAARDVYGLEGAQCFVGRVKESGFSLEPIEPVSERELRERVVRVRDGLLARDTRPVAGAWCTTCGYRSAPCQDYLRSKRM